MRGKYYRCWLSLCGAAGLSAFSGCTGSLKMPINEYSHLSFEAAPLNSEFRLSYHLYEADPVTRFKDDWETTVKLDAIGIVYDSETDRSPGFEKIERGWDDLWETETGHPDWTGVERLLADESLRDEDSNPRHHKSESLPERTDSTSRGLPLAELPLFMFSSPTGW